MATTYDSVAFKERYQSDRLPQPTGGSFRVTTHIPGSNDNHTDLLGADVKKLTILATATYANYVSIFGKRGTSHTLVYSGGSVTAILDTVSKAEIIDPGDTTVEFSMDFII